MIYVKRRFHMIYVKRRFYSESKKLKTGVCLIWESRITLRGNAFDLECCYFRHSSVRTHHGTLFEGSD